MSAVFLPKSSVAPDGKKDISTENQTLGTPVMKRDPETSLIVCRERTVSRYNNGLSKQEIVRFANTARFIERSGQPLHLAVLGDGLLDMTQAEARAVIDRFLAGVVKAQGRAHYPQYWLLIFETNGGLHANIIFVADKRMAQRLCRSFYRYMRNGYGRGKAMQPVYDAIKLATRYLSKERTIQANYALGWSSNTRTEGAHKLPGSGDRVKLSRALKAAAIAVGAIEPWQPTNARRKV